MRNSKNEVAPKPVGSKIKLNFYSTAVFTKDTEFLVGDNEELKVWSEINTKSP